MPTSPGWVQETLIPPNVVEVTLRLGVVNDGDHLQCAISATNPSTGAVLAMWSIPHRPVTELPSLIADAVRELTAMAAVYAWAV